MISPIKWLYEEFEWTCCTSIFSFKFDKRTWFLNVYFSNLSWTSISAIVEGKLSLMVSMICLNNSHSRETSLIKACWWKCRNFKTHFEFWKSRIFILSFYSNWCKWCIYLSSTGSSNDLAYKDVVQLELSFNERTGFQIYVYMWLFWWKMKFKLFNKICMVQL